ncbi:MAG: hypothetical protein RBT11_02270 [Desulfobacterales bacterium]|jgi:hypothetical protein|nr:hypothetical protein [Desulfobacterales bacterium]
MGIITNQAMIMVSVTPGYFSIPAGTRYRSNSLPLFQKHPGAASLPREIG